MPRSSQVSIGRTIVAVFDHSEDFYTALDQVCAKEPEPEEAAGLAVQLLIISAERPIASILIRARDVQTDAAPWKHLDGLRRLTAVLAECERR